MDGEKIKDLGWANDGGETERIIDETHAKCVSMGHRRSDIDVGPPHRGIEHVVKCLDGCNFVYRYDSSD